MKLPRCASPFAPPPFTVPSACSRRRLNDRRKQGLRRVRLVISFLAAILWIAPPLFAGPFEQYVCDWLELESATCDDQKLAQSFLSSLEAYVYVEPPGCTIGSTGSLWVDNNFTLLRFKIRLTATFVNPQGAPANCQGACSSSKCECSINELIESPPGTTRYAHCAFPECFDCDNCDNDTGECPFGDLFCAELDGPAVFKIEQVSCDGGENWTVLPGAQQMSLSYDVRSPCE